MASAAPKDSGAPAPAPAAPQASKSSSAEPVPALAVEQAQERDLVYELSDGQVCRFRGKDWPKRVKDDKQRVIVLPPPDEYPKLLETIRQLELSKAAFLELYHLKAASTMRIEQNKQRKAEWQADKAEAEKRLQEEAAAVAASKGTGDLLYAVGKKRLPRARAAKGALVPL